MKNGIDLHIHTSASDGLHSPAEVVRMASEAGLCAIAISDHDTVEGVPLALDAAAGQPLEVIPAVEISTEGDGNREVHVLGYFIDWTMIPLAAADRVEVVKGVGDPRYGNVLGGVINLVSKRLRTESPSTEFQAAAASFGTATFNLFHGYKPGAFEYSLAAGATPIDGRGAGSVTLMDTAAGDQVPYGVSHGRVYWTNGSAIGSVSGFRTWDAAGTVIRSIRPPLSPGSVSAPTAI